MQRPDVNVLVNALARRGILALMIFERLKTLLLATVITTAFFGLCWLLGSLLNEVQFRYFSMALLFVFLVWTVYQLLRLRQKTR